MEVAVVFMPCVIIIDTLCHGLVACYWCLCCWMVAKHIFG